MAKWLLAFVAVIAVAVAETTISPEKTTTLPPTTTPTTKFTTTTTTEPTTSTTEFTTTTTTTITTTTTVAPTTTAAPSPPAEYPNNYNNTPWLVSISAGGNNHVCIALRGAIAIRVDNSTISVPTNAKATGNCPGLQAGWLVLTWTRPSEVNKTSVKFEVERIKTNETNGDVYKFTKVTVVLPGFSEKLVSDEALFQAPIEKSYKCTAESHVNLSNNRAQLLMQKLQAEAFPETPAESFKDFHSAEECRADDVSAVVPVAVGASLIVLVVIVLVAYIIGRRRSRARGYQSV